MQKFQDEFVKAFLKSEIDNDCIDVLDEYKIDAIKKFGKFLDENLTFDGGEWKTIPEALGELREFYGTRGGRRHR